MRTELEKEKEKEKALLLEMKSKTPLSDYRTHKNLMDKINTINRQLLTLKD